MSHAVILTARHSASREIRTIQELFRRAKLPMPPVKSVTDLEGVLADDHAVQLILGSPKGFQNLPISRPWHHGDSTCIKVSAMGSPYSDAYYATLQNLTKAVKIGIRLLKEGTTDIYDMETVEATIKDVRRRIPVSGAVWYDFETTGLDPFLDEIVSLALFHIEWEDVLIIRGEEAALEVIKFLKNKGQPVAAVNGRFEQKWCIVKTGESLTLVDDPQVSQAILREDWLKALDLLCCDVGYAGYDLPMQEFLHPMNEERPSPLKDGRKNVVRHHHEAPPDMLGIYNAGDVYVCPSIKRFHVKMMNKEPGTPHDVYRWLIRGQTTLAHMEARGMRLDPTITKHEYVTHIEKEKSLANKLRKIAGKHGLNEFNPRSTPDKKKLMYEKMGYPVMMLSDKDYRLPDDWEDKWWLDRPRWGHNAHKPANPATGKKAIELIIMKEGEDEFLTTMSEYNVVSAVLDGVVSRCWHALQTGKTGCVHTQFNAVKLLTGQLSSTEPPMQNVPKTPFRRVFCSRFEGGRIWEWDYSQLHLRIIGNLAKCGRFIEAYANGVDLHSRTAAGVILGVDEDSYLSKLESGSKKCEKARDTGKRANFSIIFEIGAKALGFNIKQPVATTKTIIDNWLSYYFEIRDQIERQHDFALKHGYVISPFGRVRHLPGAKSSGRSSQYRALRQAGDYLISNSGRYINYYAMIMMDEEMRRKKMQSMIVSSVHDSVIGDIHPDEEDDVLELGQKYLVDWVSEYTEEWMNPIPLVVDGVGGPTWFKDDVETEVTFK